MRIGFEAKRAFKNLTGLGNYSRSVILSLSKTYPNNSYFLYSPNAPKNARTGFLFVLKNIFIRTAPIKILQSYWRSFGVVSNVKKDNIDVFHGLSHEIPKGLKKHQIKSVVTIHDLIFMRYPHYFKWIDRKIYFQKIKYACTHADKIIAISQQTKHDLIEFMRVSTDKIAVVYQSCDAIFHSLTLPEPSIKLNLPSCYILCVGTIETRKNQLVILKALKLLPANIQVVLVGKSTEYKSQLSKYVDDNDLASRVHFLENIPFDTLPHIYIKAKVFVYPSYFEGFGIPILEALNSGIPVIAAHGSCLEEAGGPHSLYFNPGDENELTSKINLVLEDICLAEKMIAEGKKFALNFRQDIIANNLMEVYHSVLC